MSETDAPEQVTEVSAAEGSGMPGVPWWLVVGVGVLGIIASILALVWPGKTLLLVALTFGIFLLFVGVQDLASALNTKGASGGARIFFALLGVISIVVGVILIIHPAESLLTAAWVLGLWFAISGAVQLLQAFSHPEGRGFNIAFGLLGIVAGVVVLVNPGVGVVTLVWIVSISFLIRGLVAIAVGLALKKAQAAAA
ncbi:MAG TPA: HdeD family acid-resistance protein [Baekduia sp.]|nr:HdeD family acid-resistance protein [Baekduia sp.]